MEFIGAFGFAILIAAGLLVIGIVLFFIFGYPAIKRFGEKAGGLYNPPEHASRVMPEYSVAEARVKEGRYEKAVEEYRLVIAKFPEDVYAHIRIADLAVNHLQDATLAELELMSAVAKATSEDAIVLASGRLADLYQYTLHDPARAIPVMQQIPARLPETKHALGAQHRIELLQQEASPTPQVKVPLRRSRYSAD